MRYLLDVNVLIALIDARHPAHSGVHRWYAAHTGGIALCPLVENGAARIMSQAAYAQGEARLSAAYVLRVIAKLKAHAKDCMFWPDSVSLTDTTIFDADKLLSHKQLTDSYLLGLAVSQDAGLVTTDRNMTRAAVPLAQKHQLLVI